MQSPEEADSSYLPTPSNLALCPHSSTVMSSGYSVKEGNHKRLVGDVFAKLTCVQELPLFEKPLSVLVIEAVPQSRRIPRHIFFKI